MNTVEKGAQSAALEARIGALSREADRLSDISLVKRLQRAYGYYIDRGYWQEAAELFLDDATYETGVDGVYVGKRRILEFLVRQGGGNPGPGLPYGQLSHRMQLQPVIHVAADGRVAQGRWRELALLGQFKKYAAWGDGVYENRYVKTEGTWRIGALHFYPNFVAPYEGGWAALKAVAPDWRSDAGKALAPDRPPTVRYRPFPDYHAPPFHYDPSGLPR
jgi:SnoaL-like domain